MDWLRSTIGLAPSSSSSSSPKKANAVMERHRREATQLSHEERAARFARAQAMNIEMMKEELKELESEINEAVSTGNRTEAARGLARKRQITSDLNKIEAKQKNLNQTRDAISSANSNLAQGLLVEEGATELSDTVAAMEEIDLDDAVDKIQEASSQLEYHDSLLTEPLFGEKTTAYDQFQVDEELDRLMSAHDAASHPLPDVPVEEPKQNPQKEKEDEQDDAALKSVDI